MTKLNHLQAEVKILAGNILRYFFFSEDRSDSYLRYLSHVNAKVLYAKKNSKKCHSAAIFFSKDTVN